MTTRKYRGQQSFPLSLALGLLLAAVFTILFVICGGAQP